MDDAFAHQVELIHFPTGVQVSRHPLGADFLLRAEGKGTGAELLLTQGAMKMYGEGPSTSMALTVLKEAAQRGLPPRAADGTFERLVFPGD
ncbi:hypothetical protein [Deinococcus fonticola]|uniref:hypothetical protein n=1 Tax=Deinococcus fonticola TaxID=2528713 RepID=UPI001F0E30B4|nr:hypothetical protein [Deinococcus fonticola]